MSEIEDKLTIALANVEIVKSLILHKKANTKNEQLKSNLTNYNLELLDLKLRLKDMIRNLEQIQE
jgi:hypothetical protein